MEFNAEPFAHRERPLEGSDKTDAYKNIIFTTKIHNKILYTADKSSRQRADLTAASAGPLS